MTTPRCLLGSDDLVKLLVSTFQQSATEAFRTFLSKHPSVSKWIIACDFVLNDKQASHDAYAFTFFPYIKEIPEGISQIARLAPADFKKSNQISDTMKAYLHSGETFTVCLLTPKKLNPAGNIHDVRKGLDHTLLEMRAWHDASAQQVTIKAFEDLRHRANSNSCKAALMSTMMISTALAAFCALVLAQERDVDVVGWFPDRDSITEAYDRIANLMFGVNVSAFCQQHKIDAAKIRTVVGLPVAAPGAPNKMWYDELIRIPDFFAGALAAWDFKNNLVTARWKYVDFLQEGVADNPFLVVLLLMPTVDGPLRVSRLLTSKTPTTGSESCRAE
jgi:hypothetical protein